MMVDPEKFIDELMDATRPLDEPTAVVLREEPNRSDKTNWHVFIGPQRPATEARFEKKRAEMREQYPQVDFAGVTERESGYGRVVTRWVNK